MNGFLGGETGLEKGLQSLIDSPNRRREQFAGLWEPTLDGDLTSVEERDRSFRRSIEIFLPSTRHGTTAETPSFRRNHLEEVAKRHGRTQLFGRGGSSRVARSPLDVTE